MAISLQKGGNVNLSKEAPGLTSLKVALGWDVRATDGAAFDLDGAVFLLNSSGKVRSDSDFIFYNNLKSADGSIVHSGDNTTGAGEGDDEFVTIDLTKVPADVDKSPEFRHGRQGLHPLRQQRHQPGSRALRSVGRQLDRSGDDLRRGVPQRRRLEVPRDRPGLQRRPGPTGPQLRRERLR
jgi:hypothetical protein